MFGSSPLMAETTPPLVVGVSSTTVNASSTNSSITSASIGCNVSGGVPPYNYSWVKASGAAVTATTPGAQYTTFSGTGIAAGATYNALFNCVVTDAAGQTTTSPTVSVSLSHLATVLATVTPNVDYYEEITGVTATSPEYTCTGSDGTAPYAYVWSRLSGSSYIGVFPTADRPTVRFSHSSGTMAKGETRTARFWCRVYDNAGLEDQSNFVTITFKRIA